MNTRQSAKPSASNGHPSQHLHSLSLPSGPISYRRMGNGPPIVLIHGWGGTSLYWEDVMEKLEQTHTCYALDLPGYGETPPIPPPASADRLADIVIGFANALDIKQFDLNGHSFGGAITTYIAARHPERVRRLIHTSFGTVTSDVEQMWLSQIYYPMDVTMTMWKPWLLISKPWFDQWQQMIADTGCSTKFSHEAARPFFHRLPENDERVCKAYADFMRMDYRSSLESVISMGNPTLRAAMKHITVPTMLISGRQDRVALPSNIESAASIIPNCHIAWIDQCGHVPMIEQSHEYSRIISSFLFG